MHTHPNARPLRRCQVAQEMRRRLALLVDVTKPPNERWDAMNFVIGTPDTIRLACKLQGGMQAARWKCLLHIHAPIQQGAGREPRAPHLHSYHCNKWSTLRRQAPPALQCLPGPSTRLLLKLGALSCIYCSSQRSSCWNRPFRRTSQLAWGLRPCTRSTSPALCEPVLQHSSG